MAAIGREQLKKIDIFSKRRMQIAKRYVSELVDITNVDLLDISYDSLIPHIFPIRILNGERKKVINTLSELGIETGTHYQPNHLLSYYASLYSLPVTELLSTELLSIPMHPDISDLDQTRIIQGIRTALEEKL